MSFFGALARATGLASPASEAPGSSSTSTASSSKLNQHLVRDAVSPTNRNATSSNKNTPRQASRAMDLHTVKGSKIKGNKISKAKGHDRKDKRKSLWDFAHISSFFGKDQDGEEKSEGDMEGDTLVDCDSPIPTTEDGNDRTMVEDARYVYCCGDLTLFGLRIESYKRAMGARISFLSALCSRDLSS